jgi:uracil-DNA glycosylase
LNKELHRINQHMGSFLKQIYGSSLPLLSGVGNTGAKLLIAHDMPSHEDIAAPYHRPGSELDGMLMDIGITTEDVYMTYIVKFAPHGRRPSYEEETLSLPWFAKEVETVSPKVVTVLGATALSMMGVHETLTKVHGQLIHIALYGTSFDIIPLFHPERLKQAEREIFREGLKKVSERINTCNGYRN